MSAPSHRYVTALVFGALAGGWQEACPIWASPQCMRHCCDCRRHRRRRGISPTLKAFAAKLRAADGSQPLKPGERRPEGYFIMNHFTGESDIPTGAVEKIEN